MIRSLSAILIIVLVASRAGAALDPPLRVLAPDSSTVIYERGVELARLTEIASTHQRLFPNLNWVANARWKTEWQSPQGETHRIRQDGRWYTGLNRRFSRLFTLWAASSGEHFDDRPTRTSAIPRGVEPLNPRLPDMGAADLIFTPATATSVHILRGGGGVSSNLWPPLTVDAGLGGVQDRRFGRVEGGLGFWSRADLDHWDLGGYDQTLALQYHRETPQNHENSDLIGRYENFREFFPGNTNRGEASASILSRDVYLTTSAQLTRRTEKHFAVRDELAYDLRKNISVKMTGDISNESTDQGQSGGTTSSLKENQAGFATGVTAGTAKSNAQVTIGLRSVTQTIRGEILQGRKGDLSLQGRTILPWESNLSLRLGVSKYALDTPNPQNYDDRDELRYTTEVTWTKPLFRSLIYELHGAARLDHLVYLYRQSSANNRWTRFFLAGSTIRHRPNSWFMQTVRVSVSANYQDYDYETDPRTTRSTVFRRLLMGDTLSFGLSSRLSLNGHVGYAIEEFGRLFWESFEEERSDQTHSYNLALELAHRFPDALRAGAGAMWDRRRGKRFPDNTRASEKVFQDLQSYGPTFFVERKPRHGFYLSLHGRVLRQLQLNREDRWLTLGEAVGGFLW